MFPIHKNPLRWRPKPDKERETHGFARPFGDRTKPEERLKLATARVGFATAVVVLLVAVVELVKLAAGW